MGELPRDYRDELAASSLIAAWTELKDIVPTSKPRHMSVPAAWHWRNLRPLLLRATDLASVEEAERRVLGLINPGFTGKRLATTSSMFIGMQVILPGETAPDHRHTPGAARLILEGEGAFTAVDGKKLMMEPGDLLLTPPHHFHAHGHDGSAPAIWMDILDHPVAIPLEASYLVEGNPHAAAKAKPDNQYWLYSQGGLVPFRGPATPPPDYPLLCYRWVEVRAALVRAAAHSESPVVHLMYINPCTGGPALKTLCFSVMMLRPGANHLARRRSASAVLFGMEGHGKAIIDGNLFEWERGDVIAAPTHASVRIRNTSSMPSFLLQIDDGPLQHSLGYYEEFAD